MMKSESLKIGKLYELKVLKAGGELVPPGIYASVSMWDNKPNIKNSTKVGDYKFNSGPFLVLEKHNDSEYQILAPNEKIGWAYFGSYIINPKFYFIELVERNPVK